MLNTEERMILMAAQAVLRRYRVPVNNPNSYMEGWGAGRAEVRAQQAAEAIELVMGHENYVAETQAQALPTEDFAET